MKVRSIFKYPDTYQPDPTWRSASRAAVHRLAVAVILSMLACAVARDALSQTAPPPQLPPAPKGVPSFVIPPLPICKNTADDCKVYADLVAQARLQYAVAQNTLQHVPDMLAQAAGLEQNAASLRQNAQTSLRDAAYEAQAAQASSQAAARETNPTVQRQDQADTATHQSRVTRDQQEAAQWNQQAAAEQAQAQNLRQAAASAQATFDYWSQALAAAETAYRACMQLPPCQPPRQTTGAAPSANQTNTVTTGANAATATGANTAMPQLTIVNATGTPTNSLTTTAPFQIQLTLPPGTATTDPITVTVTNPSLYFSGMRSQTVTLTPNPSNPNLFSSSFIQVDTKTTSALGSPIDNYWISTSNGDSLTATFNWNGALVNNTFTVYDSQLQQAAGNADTFVAARQQELQLSIAFSNQAIIDANKLLATTSDPTVRAQLTQQIKVSENAITSANNQLQAVSWYYGFSNYYAGSTQAYYKIELFNRLLPYMDGSLANDPNAMRTIDTAVNDAIYSARNSVIQNAFVPYLRLTSIQLYQLSANATFAGNLWVLTTQTTIMGDQAHTTDYVFAIGGLGFELAGPKMISMGVESALGFGGPKVHTLEIVIASGGTKATPTGVVPVAGGSTGVSGGRVPEAATAESHAATAGTPAEGSWAPGRAFSSDENVNAQQLSQHLDQQLGQMAINDVNRQIALAKEAGVPDAEIAKITERFNPNGSIGNNQKIAYDLNAARLRKLGFDLDISHEDLVQIQTMSTRSYTSGLTAEDVGWLQSKLNEDPHYLDLPTGLPDSPITHPSLTQRGVITDFHRFTEGAYAKVTPGEGFVGALSNSSDIQQLRDGFVKAGGKLPEQTPGGATATGQGANTNTAGAAPVIKANNANPFPDPFATETSPGETPTWHDTQQPGGTNSVHQPGGVNPQTGASQQQQFVQPVSPVSNLPRMQIEPTPEVIGPMTGQGPRSLGEMEGKPNAATQSAQSNTPTSSGTQTSQGNSFGRQVGADVQRRLAENRTGTGENASQTTNNNPGAQANTANPNPGVEATNNPAPNTQGQNANTTGSGTTGGVKTPTNMDALLHNPNAPLTPPTEIQVLPGFPHPQSTGGEQQQQNQSTTGTGNPISSNSTATNGNTSGASQVAFLNRPVAMPSMGVNTAGRAGKTVAELSPETAAIPGDSSVPESDGLGWGGAFTPDPPPRTAQVPTELNNLTTDQNGTANVVQICVQDPGACSDTFSVDTMHQLEFGSSALTQGADNHATSSGGVELASLSIPGALSFIAPGTIVRLAPALPAFPPNESPAISLVANGNSAGEAFVMQMRDPSGRVKDIVLPEGTVLQPLKRNASKEPARRAGAAASHILTKKVSAFCLEYAKLPPEVGMFYRVADQELQNKFKPLRYYLEAGRKLGAEGKFHPDSNREQYAISIMQFTLWALIGHWDQKTFTQMFLERTRKNAEAAGVKWTKEMENTFLAAAPGRWRDIGQVVELGKILESQGQVADAAPAAAASVTTIHAPAQP